MNMWFLPTSCSFQDPCEQVNCLTVSLHEDRNLAVLNMFVGGMSFDRRSRHVVLTRKGGIQWKCRPFIHLVNGV